MIDIHCHIVPNIDDGARSLDDIFYFIGKKNLSVATLLEKVNPRIALIGVGKNNKFGHPSDGTIKNLNDESKPASTKFWELEKQIKKDRRHPGVIMELEKSETVWNIVELLRKKVITQKELVDFSDDLQQEVKRIMDIRRG